MPAPEKAATVPGATRPTGALPPDAACIAALLAVDPVGLGGAVLRARAGPARDAWLRLLAQHLPPDMPQRRVPLHVSDERLLGGLDLPATLNAGRPVAQRGLLAEADGGLVMLAMAERLPAATAARIAAVLDTQVLRTERDGLALCATSRVGVIALDEGSADDEQAPARLADRLAFHIALENAVETAPAPDPPPPAWSPSDVAQARARLDQVEVSDELLQALCAAALALGVRSLRAAQLAVRATRAVAALAGAATAEARHAALAARWVLAHRATQWPTPTAEDAQPSGPQAPQDAAEPAAPQGHERHEPQDSPAAPPSPDTGELDDIVLQAALAALPAGLLAQLKLGSTSRPPAAPTPGRAGAVQAGRQRGRPQGVRRGEPRGGQRLHLIDTLRAAAPWQALRRREAGSAGSTPRVQVRREDFHVTRLKQRSQTTTVFVVDASGSAALHRLAEAKGAVELLLADCYVRRDHVAVIAFRGRGAELLLPPTRSLVRAKRALAGLPGGGGTPLAAGIDAAARLADALRRRGGTPLVVLLTDGRANIALDGSAGRAQAGADALAAARQLHLAGFAALLLDTSPQPQEPARHLALALGAPTCRCPMPAPRRCWARCAAPARRAEGRTRCPARWPGSTTAPPGRCMRPAASSARPGCAGTCRCWARAPCCCCCTAPARPRIPGAPSRPGWRRTPGC